MSSLSNSDNDLPSLASSAATKAVEFARVIGKLKTVPRTGWVRRGVPKYESVADHSWRVAALALLLVGREDVDASKVLTMAVIHDMAEAVVGDIAPDDNVTKEEKQQMEEQAMSRLAECLGSAEESGRAAHLLSTLFHEYEVRESVEAKVVKDLDLLDMILQADEYEQRFGIDLSEFFEGTPPNKFQDAALRSISEEVHRQRKERVERTSTDESTAVVNLLSKSDEAFVEEFGQASKLGKESVKELVRALRGWKSSHTDS